MEKLVIGLGLIVVHAAFLVFGFGTGTMRSLIPGVSAADKDGRIGWFWVIAFINLMWIAVGVFAVAKAA